MTDVTYFYRDNHTLSFYCLSSSLHDDVLRDADFPLFTLYVMESFIAARWDGLVTGALVDHERAAFLSSVIARRCRRLDSADDLSPAVFAFICAEPLMPAAIFSRIACFIGDDSSITFSVATTALAR